MKNSEDKKLLLAVFFAGFAVLELEILTPRILSPVFGGTIFVWSSIIAATLAYLSLGYFSGGKLADRGKININRVGFVLLITGVYVALLPFISRSLLPLTNDFGVMFGPLISAFALLAIPMFLLGLVSPSAIKLITKSLERVGSRAGEIFAFGTLGSIAGALITGFVLIPSIGVAAASTVTGLVLIVISFFLIKSRTKYLAILLIASLFLVPQQQPPEILESFDSFYGQIRVIDHNFGEYGTVRRVYLDTLPQSAVNVNTRENEMGYIEFFEIPLLYNSGYTRALMIGLGGGATAKEMVNKHNLEMDVVEIEPRMLDLAEEYFYWEGEATVYFDDARHFLSSAGTYDVIFIDIGYVFPTWHLYTLEAFQQYSDHLNGDGALVINLFSGKEGKHGRVTQTLFKTLERVFGDVFLLRDPSSDPDDTHAMALLAFKKEIERGKFSSLPHRLSMQEILDDNDNFIIQDSIVLNTDDRPVAEFYDYESWETFGLIGRDRLKYFLP